MADFDPLGIVKAMGPQTDPFSWAQAYAKDAGQQDALGKELRNKMLIAQMSKEAQAEEGRANRESREGIAGLSRASQERIWKQRLMEYRERREQAAKHYAGGNIMSEQEFANRVLGIGAKINPDEWETGMLHGKLIKKRKGVKLDLDNLGRAVDATTAVPDAPASNPYRDAFPGE